MQSRRSSAFKEDRQDGEIRTTTIKLHDAQAAIITLMKHHGLLKVDLGKGEMPKTERELDELLTAEIRRVKGDEAADAIAEVLRRFAGPPDWKVHSPDGGRIYELTGRKTLRTLDSRSAAHCEVAAGTFPNCLAFKSAATGRAGGLMKG